VSGIAYDYEGVTKDLYEKFRHASSKGKFLNTERTSPDYAIEF